MNIQDASFKMTSALSLEMDVLKNFGVLYPEKDLIKSIGIKYYIFFWRRRLYFAKEILKRCYE